MIFCIGSAHWVSKSIVNNWLIKKEIVYTYDIDSSILLIKL